MGGLRERAKQVVNVAPGVTGDAVSRATAFRGFPVGAQEIKRELNFTDFLCCLLSRSDEVSAAFFHVYLSDCLHSSDVGLNRARGKAPILRARETLVERQARLAR